MQYNAHLGCTECEANKCCKWRSACRVRAKNMDKDKADRRAMDKDRAKIIRNDNELGDEDEDDEPWQRKLIHTRLAQRPQLTCS